MVGRQCELQEYKKKPGCEGEGGKKQRMENVSGNGREEIQEGGDKKKCEESISEGGKEAAKKKNKKSGMNVEGRRERASEPHHGSVCLARCHHAVGTNCWR